MKKFIVLLVLIGITLALSLQINFSVSGSAQEQRVASETWSGEKDLTTNYTVVEGNTLTILPGTTVRLGEDVSIVVKGTLKAEGNENSMITITRLGNISYWDKLHFDTTSTDSLLKYCRIEWGYIYCYFSAPTISYCTISNMHTQCLYALRCTLNISHTTIHSPENCGIYVKDATIEASYNKIYNQPATAIYCDNSVGNILYNDLSGPACGIACHHSSPTITNNYVHDCNWGIYVRYQESTPVICYNDIVSNQQGVKCYLKPSPKINYNNIQGNRDWGVISEENVLTPFYSVDAKNNYWGAGNGPSGQGSGNGDKVSRNVDYDPWLAEKVVVGVEPPKASFIYSFTNETQTIQFTCTSTDDVRIVSRHWDFGDGNISTLQNPTHQYLKGNKTYTVTLTVIDSDGDQDVSSEQVFVPLGGPDLDGDNIPNELDDDRDGDGYLNWEDAYPDDPLKYKEEAVGVEEKPSFAPIIAGVVIAVLIIAAIAAGVAIRKKPAKVAKPTTVIDEVFLLYRDGRLIKHLTRRLKPMDDEILASMLTAVQDFVKDVFRGEPGELEEMKFGELKFIIGRGEFITIATIISGPELALVKPQIAKAIKAIEKEHWGVLERWDGDLDKVTPLTEHLEALIEGKYR